MKLTGSLANIAFDDVLILLVQYRGTIQIWDLPGDAGVRLDIEQGKIKAFFVNYRPVSSKSKITKIVAQLFDIKKGVFSFNPKPPEALENNLELDIQQLSLNAAVLLDDTKKIGTANNLLTVDTEMHTEQTLIAHVNNLVGDLQSRFHHVEGIVISTHEEPLKFGDTQKITELITTFNKKDAAHSTTHRVVTHAVIVCQHGDLGEAVLQELDFTLLVYRLENFKSIFCVKGIDKNLHHQIREVALQIVEFWMGSAKPKTL
ncbi:MAG: hypothetical protein AAF708_07745 [Deinococcota bacterium]